MIEVKFDPTELKGDLKTWWDKWEKNASSKTADLIKKWEDSKNITSKDFDNNIWSDLKKWLMENFFNGKCAYCETHIHESRQSGDAEHFRPKGAVTYKEEGNTKETKALTKDEKGQTIEHPGYSGVTLALLHGVCPDAMIICTCPTRHYHDKRDDCPIAPIEQQIRLYESLAAPVHPARVVGVAVNTAGLDEAEATRHIAALAERTNLPTCDPIRNGVAPLLAALRAELGV